MLSTMIWLSLVCLVPVALANFRMQCSTLVTERLDPLVFSGQLGSHMHTVFGASGFGASTDVASLNNSLCTTCSVANDQSVYWMPTVYFHFKNGSFAALPPPNTGIYYGFDKDTTVPPRGLSMIKGHFDSRSPSLLNMGISFSCRRSADDTSTSTMSWPTFPPMQCPDNSMSASVVFNQCWDGRQLYNASQSHVVGTQTDGSCPPTHSVKIPMVFIEASWSTAPFDGIRDQAMNPTQPFVLAQGDPTGYGLHADLIFNWDEVALGKAIKTCTATNNFGNYCTPFTYVASDTCIKAPDVDEANGDGLLITTLPGDCQLTPGPKDSADCGGVASTLNSGLPLVAKFNTTCPATEIVPSYRTYAYHGCVAANSPPLPNLISLPQMTALSCLEACDAQNAAMCAISAGSQCHYGTQLKASIMLETEEYQCHSTPCQGDHSQACGLQYLVYQRNGQLVAPKLNPVNQNSQAGCPALPFSDYFAYQAHSGVNQTGKDTHLQNNNLAIPHKSSSASPGGTVTSQHCWSCVLNGSGVSLQTIAIALVGIFTFNYWF